MRAWNRRSRAGWSGNSAARGGRMAKATKTAGKYAPQARMNWAYAVPGLSLADRGMLLALIKYANGKTGECWPSIKTMCETMGVTRPTVLRHLRHLEDRKVISKVAQDGKPHTYQLHIKPLSEPLPLKKTIGLTKMNEGGNKNDRQGVTKMNEGGKGSVTLTFQNRKRTEKEQGSESVSQIIGGNGKMDGFAMPPAEHEQTPEEEADRKRLLAEQKEVLRKRGDLT